jgi:hypothetical protein
MRYLTNGSPVVVLEFINLSNVMTNTESSNVVMGQLKPTLDAFMRKHSSKDLTDLMRTELVQMIDVALKSLGYDDRLIRLVEPQPNGDTPILVFVRTKEQKKKNEFIMTTITIRGRVVPEEIK